MSILPDADHTPPTGFAGLASLVSDVDGLLATIPSRPVSPTQPAQSQEAPNTPPQSAVATPPVRPRGGASTAPPSTGSGRRWPWALGTAIVLGWLWLAARSESAPASRAGPTYPLAQAPTPPPPASAPERPTPTLTGSHSMTVDLAGTMRNGGDDAPIALKCWGTTPLRVNMAGVDLRGVIGPGELTCRVLGQTFPVEWNQGFEGSEIDSKVSFSDGSCKYSGNATGGLVDCSESDTAYSASLSGTWRLESKMASGEADGESRVPAAAPDFAGEWDMVLDLKGQGTDADGSVYPTTCSGTTKVSMEQNGEVLRGTTGDGDVSCAMGGRSFSTGWAGTLEGTHNGTSAFFSANNCDFAGPPSGGTVTCQYSSTANNFSIVLKGTWRRAEGGHDEYQ